MLPPVIQSHLLSEHGIRLSGAKPVSGGDINQVALLTAHDGRQYFIKYNRGDSAAGMLRTEALGLQALGEPGVIAVPEVIAQGSAPGGWAWLLLEYIAPGHQNRAFWECFGQSLAALHEQSAAQYGLDHDNYIGSLPQSNTRYDTWVEFYAETRLRPQMRMAIAQKQLTAADERRLEALCNRLPSICPEEPPALIHGDLWGGNFLCNTHSLPVLIDPAACYAHREMDLAMSRLFGGFDPVFYESYETARPIAPGFEERIEVYQLYYLLVHVNLFGGGYAGSARRILERWG